MIEGKFRYDLYKQRSTNLHFELILKEYAFFKESKK